MSDLIITERFAGFDDGVYFYALVARRQTRNHRPVHYSIIARRELGEMVAKVKTVLVLSDGSTVDFDIDTMNCPAPFQLEACAMQAAHCLGGDVLIMTDYIDGKPEAIRPV